MERSSPTQRRLSRESEELPGEPQSRKILTVGLKGGGVSPRTWRKKEKAKNRRVGAVAEAGLGVQSAIR